VSLKFKHEGNKIQHKFNDESFLRLWNFWNLFRIQSLT
jgi:hypothetical protein